MLRLILYLWNTIQIASSIKTSLGIDGLELWQLWKNPFQSIQHFSPSTCPLLHFRFGTFIIPFAFLPFAARSFVCSAEEQEQSNQSFCQTIRNMTICQKICVTFLDSPLVGEAVNRPARWSHRWYITAISNIHFPAPHHPGERTECWAHFKCVPHPRRGCGVEWVAWWGALLVVASWEWVAVAAE